MKWKAALSFLVVFFVTHAEAQSESNSLSLQQLLRQVSISHQGMEIARARIRAAEASEMAARGAFDLQIEAHARTAPVGRYGSSSAIVGVRQPTTIHGLDLGLWYENGADFPSYSEEFITSTGGKVSFKALLPLLRNGRVDSDRYRRFEARLSREIAERSAAQVRADLFAAASRAWWNWAIAGQRLGNYASQLRLAEDRARMLEEEVRSGAVPAIDLVDNQRLVLSRRAALSLGELSLTRSAFAVSNFYRDNDGDPIKVSHENLPRELGGDLTWDQTYGDSMRMLQESPALAARRLTLEILNEEIHLAKNGLLPRLDLGLDAGHARGEPRPYPYVGSSTSESTVAGSLTFQSPFQLRQARGKLAELRAKRSEAELELRLLEDQLKFQLAVLHEALRSQKQAYVLNREARQAAEEMARAEREKFVLGESSVLAVNIREDAVLRAREDELETLLQFHLTWIELMRSIGRQQPDGYVLTSEGRKDKS